MPEAEGLRAPGGHGELLGRAVARLRQDERVVALILGGSLARGAADLYSDVDLYVVVRDGAFDAILAERDAVTEVVGSRLFAFDVDPVSGGSTDRIVLYGGQTANRSSSISCTLKSPTSCRPRSGRAARSWRTKAVASGPSSPARKASRRHRPSPMNSGS